MSKSDVKILWYTDESTIDEDVSMRTLYSLLVLLGRGARRVKGAFIWDDPNDPDTLLLSALRRQMQRERSGQSDLPARAASRPARAGKGSITQTRNHPRDTALQARLPHQHCLDSDWGRPANAEASGQPKPVTHPTRHTCHYSSTKTWHPKEITNETNYFYKYFGITLSKDSRN
jgi:hypothetical protein